MSSTGTHFSCEELIVLLNKISDRKGIKPLPLNTKISASEICDRIEAVQHKSVKRTPPEKRRWLAWLLYIWESDMIAIIGKTEAVIDFFGLCSYNEHVISWRWFVFTHPQRRIS